MPKIRPPPKKSSNVLKLSFTETLNWFESKLTFRPRWIDRIPE